MRTAPGTIIAAMLLLAALLLASSTAGAQEPLEPSEPAPPAEPALDVAPPSRAAGGTVARIVAPSFARARLDAPRRGWRVRTATAWSGQPQVLLVLGSAVREGREWVKLLLADRPNGSAGWVPLDHVVLGRTRWWVDVSTRARRVTVYRDGRRLRSFRAVVGAPATPTPHVLSAVYEINRQPDPRAFLGPWVLALTSLSNVLDNYGGGPGRVAIHGRAAESLRDPLGSARSKGCVRVDDRPVTWMAANLPAGTPVMLRR